MAVQNSPLFLIKSKQRSAVREAKKILGSGFFTVKAGSMRTTINSWLQNMEGTVIRRDG
jgi:hypothetical protein